MRRLLPLMLLLAAAAPVPPSADLGSVSLSPDAETAWVPFEITPGNQVRFQLLLDGRAVSAVLDTGVSFSVLSRRYADDAHLPTQAGGNADAIGGVVPIGWADTHQITIGGLTRAGGRLAVAPLPAVATGSATPVEMLVGRDLIGSAALDIDYQNRRFRLIPSGRLPFAGVSAPLVVSRDRRVYVTRLTLGATTLDPMIVDTGDGSAVTIAAAGWNAAGLAGMRTTSALGYGLAGPFTSTVAIVPTVALGGLVARQVEVRVEGIGGFSEQIGVAGRIGTGFLQHYRVLMDPSAGRMVFSPGPGADQPPLRSTSGLLLGLQRDRLKVVHVMRGGPAEATGFKSGDFICSVDGHAVDGQYVSSGLAGWTVGAPGRVVRVGLCDGPVRPLTLASFY